MDIRELGRLLSEQLTGKDQHISTQSSEQTSEAAQPVSVDTARQEIVRQLLSVLKLTDVNKEIIEALTRSLSRAHPATQTEISLDPSKQTLTDQTITNVKEIEKLLLKLTKGQESDPLTKASPQSAELDPRSKDTLQNIQRSLQSILDSLNKSQYKLEQTSSVTTQVDAIPQLGELLEKITNSSRTIELSSLKQFITDHISHIREANSQAGIELLNPKSLHILDPLIQTLRSIEKRLESSSDPAAKEFRVFIKELSTTLADHVASNSSDAAIRSTLTTAKSELLEQKQNAPVESLFSKEISKIYSQIDTLLSMPDIDLSTGKGTLSPGDIARITPYIAAVRESFIRIHELIVQSGNDSDEVAKAIALLDKLSPEELKVIRPAKLQSLLNEIKENLGLFEESNPSLLRASRDSALQSNLTQSIRAIIREASGLRLLTELENISAPELALKHAAQMVGDRIRETMMITDKNIQTPLLSSESSPMTLQILRNPEILLSDPIALSKDQLNTLARTLEKDLQNALVHIKENTERASADNSRKLSHSIKLTERMLTATIELLNSEQANTQFPPLALIDSLRLSLPPVIQDFKTLTEAGLGSAKVLKNLIELQIKLTDEKISRDELKTILQTLTGDIANVLEDTLDRQDIDLTKTPAADSRHIDRTLKNAKINPQRVEDLLSGVKLDARALGELNALKSVESMLQGQELIRKLNPIMKALGEPAFILFPTLVQGLLTKTEISFFTSYDPADEGRKKKRSSGSGNPYSCALMVLELPNMGNLGVHVAHRADEILINFTTLNGSVKDFIEPRLTKLSLILQGLGFKSPKLSARTGEPQRATPEWIDALAEAHGIVA